MPTESKPPNVFICYAHEDVENAIELYNRLTAAGADPWLDKRKLKPGDRPWEDHIKRAVDQADTVVVCLRPGFDEIGFRQKEICWALQALQLRPPQQGFIIPFIIKPIKSSELPDWCQDVHAGADLSKPSSFKELVDAIEKHCCRPLVPITRTQRRLRYLVDNLIGPGADLSERAAAAKELKGFGPDAKGAVPALAGALKDPDNDVRWAAARALGKIGPDAKDAVSALAGALKDLDSDVRWAAARALGKIGPDAKDAVSALAEALKDPDEQIYYEIAWALKRIGPIAQDAVPALVEASKAPDDFRSWVALWALAQTAGPGAREAIPVLIEAWVMKDETYLRQNIAAALGRIGPDAKDAIPSLTEALEDEDEWVRKAAASALDEILQAPQECLG